MASFRLLLLPTTLSPLSPPIPSLHVSRPPSRHAHLSSVRHRRKSTPLTHHSEKTNTNTLPRTVKVSSQLRYPIVAPDDHWGMWTALFSAGAFGLWSEKTKIGSMVSAALVSTLVGLAASNAGIIPYEAPAYSVVMEFLLPLSIPLLLFRADLRNVIRSTGTLLLAFLLAAVATTIGTFVAFLLVPMRSLGADNWKIAAALMGSYIGGSVNYVAISEALGVSPSVLAAGVAADNVICAIYFIVLFAIASKIPPEDSTTSNDAAAKTESDNDGKLSVLQIGTAITTSFVICKAGTFITKLSGIQGGSLPGITAIVVVLATLLPSHFGRLAPAGDAIALVLLQVFFAAIGASGSIWNVISTAPGVFLFALVQVTVHLALVLGLGRLFRLDLKLLLLASNANIGGPTTACGMATAKGWGSLVVPAILAGIFELLDSSSDSVFQEKRKNMGNYAVLKMIFLVVFVGWLLVWTLLPTKTYKNKWTPKLNSNLNSTYFREQGTNILLFSFPIMFIAALSCVYLHLQMIKKSNKSSKSESHNVFTSRLASWRRPVLVKAPLGIVNAVELCFVVMFLALLIWSLANYLYVSFGHLHMHKEGEKIWQAKFRSVSLRLGYIGNICWAFLFFPVTRGSSILPLVGLTSESGIKYHIWLGHLSMILFVAHTVGFIIYWAMTDQMAEMLEWSSTYVSNVAGEIATVIAVVMWVTSIQRVRRKMFELFFYTHYLYTVYIIFYVLHVGAAYFCMILPGIFLFLIDRFLRFLQSWDHARLLSARVLPCGAVELNFSKSLGLQYNPTSIMFINVPTISKLQWHPFTVTSNCNTEPDKLSVVIKSVGSWSQKLYKQLSSSPDHLEVSVEGPYGPSSFSFLRHESLIMVGGGSGVTPFISIIREILFQSTKPNCHIPRITLICAFKNSSDLSMLDLLLPISGAYCDHISQIQLQIEAYVTQEKEQPKVEAQKSLQTIWFKPNPMDKPISTALGPNNWLWLGAIIASSFVLFLLVLGLVTRYYIYPYDQKPGQFYHYSYRVLWDMFLVCACICLVSSVAFVLCKRRNAMEDKKIENVEMSTSTTSPAVWPYVADDNGEIESLPNQPLVEAMKVHFGARPDLKKILFDSKASDVGVLVCGPRKMRHEVAKICASGLADNLHFESISFNW